MKKIFAIILCTAFVQLCGCTQTQTESTETVCENIAEETSAEASENVSKIAENPQNSEEDTEVKSNENKTNLLGGLSPEKALEYMKNTENLVIVEVNTAQWKKPTPFTGAMWIPHDEMAERYDGIPEGCPVILHCGAVVVSVPAYETLIEKRPDIPELSYIDGAPPIAEYDKLYKNNK